MRGISKLTLPIPFVLDALKGDASPLKTSLKKEAYNNKKGTNGATKDKKEKEEDLRIARNKVREAIAKIESDNKKLELKEDGLSTVKQSEEKM